MKKRETFATIDVDRFAAPPERELAIAVMMTAIDDLVKNRGNLGAASTRTRREADEWVRSNDESWPYSFINLCALLNVPAADLRRRLFDTPEAFRHLRVDVAA